MDYPLVEALKTQEKGSKQIIINRSGDECYIFWELVARQLRAMPPKNRKKCIFNIMRIIYSAEMGNE